MHPPSPKQLIIAAGLVPSRWLAPGSVARQAPALAALPGLTADAVVPPASPAASVEAPADGPRELAHDRLLRGLLTAPVAAGAMGAVRAAAGLPREQWPAAGREGWILEPVGFHLARDHLVLDADAAEILAADDALRLIEAIRPLTDDDGYRLTMITPRQWWLTPLDAAQPWRLDSVALDLATGRHVGDWMAGGPDARRLRRFLNEVQMTWHALLDGPLAGTTPLAAINGLWFTGPVTGAAIADYRDLIDTGRIEVETGLVAARVADDPQRWLDGLAALAPRIVAALSPAAASAGAGDPAPARVLLCGDDAIRELRPDSPTAAGRTASDRSFAGSFAGSPAGSRSGSFARAVGQTLGRLLGRSPGRRGAGDATAPTRALEPLFSEPAASDR